MTMKREARPRKYYCNCEVWLGAKVDYFVFWLKISAVSKVISKRIHYKSPQCVCFLRTCVIISTSPKYEFK